MNQAASKRNLNAAMRILALRAICLSVAAVAIRNLTPGPLGFPDSDGCACLVSYTTHPPQAARERTRPIHFDGLAWQQLLACLSYLDLNK